MYNRFVAIDFETANHNRYSACALGIVIVENLAVTEKFYALIKPPERYFTFSNIHGIKWADVRDKPGFGELWTDIRRFFEEVDFIAAHNVQFDRSVLNACCNQYNIKPPRKQYKCTCQLSRKLLGLENNRLETVCSHFDIRLKHHDALSDAFACAQIMIHFMS